MSRWGKPIKNTKQKDPRYFLTEQSIFSAEDGSINREVLTQLYGKAEGGDKEAARILYDAAENLANRGEKFSPVDGTKIEKQAIAKAYGLNVGNQSGQQDNPMQNIQDMFAQQITQIQNKFQKEQELINKQSLQFFQQQEDQIQQTMDKFKSDSEYRKKLIDEEHVSKEQTQNKFNQLVKVLKDDGEASQIIRQNFKAWQDDRDNAGKEYDSGEKETDDYLVLQQQKAFINKKWSKVLDDLIQKATKGVENE
jgi:hypothetical protein